MYLTGETDTIRMQITYKWYKLRLYTKIIYVQKVVDWLSVVPSYLFIIHLRHVELWRTSSVRISFCQDTTCILIP